MSIAQNKTLIEQYNKEVIEKGNMEFFKKIASPNLINHSAQEGMPTGIEGMIYFFASILHPAFSQLKVEIKDMIADEQKVATRKIITGFHTGELMGIKATGKQVSISIIDMIYIEDGKIKDHWGENNFPSVIQSLQS